MSPLDKLLGDSNECAMLLDNNDCVALHTLGVIVGSSTDDSEGDTGDANEFQMSRRQRKKMNKKKKQAQRQESTPAVASIGGSSAGLRAAEPHNASATSPSSTAGPGTVDVYVGKVDAASTKNDVSKQLKAMGIRGQHVKIEQLTRDETAQWKSIKVTVPGENCSSH